MTLVSTALLAVSLAGSSAFNGTWLIDLGKGNMPVDEVISLNRNIFTRGDPVDITVPSDGKVHVIADDNYIDAAAVAVLSPLRVRETNSLGGRPVYEVKYEVSPDHLKLNREVIDLSKPDHKPILTKIIYRRIGRPVLGGHHALTGRWRATGVATTQEHLTQRITISDNVYSNVGPGGYGYKALIGGPAAPVKGDAPTARTAVSMPNDHTVVEKMSLRGAATVVKTMTLLPGQRTIRVTGKRLTDGTRFEWLMHKQ